MGGMKERLFGGKGDKLDGLHGAEARSMSSQVDEEKSTRDVRYHHPGVIML